MKEANPKIVGGLVGGVVLGTFSLLYACGDDAAAEATDVVDASTPDTAPVSQDGGAPDVQTPADAPAPDAAVACPAGALFCDDFDQANRTDALDGWSVFDGAADNFSLSESDFATAPRALRVKRPMHSGVTAEKLINVTKSTVTIHIDYRLATEEESVPVIPPVLVDVYPRPAQKLTNSLLINHRGVNAYWEYDDGEGTADTTQITSALNLWHHAKIVLVAGGAGVVGTVAVDGKAPASLTLPSTSMTMIALHVGQIYAEDPPDQATVLIDNVVVSEE